jgi:acyl-CoA synthetase (AMP-forming)/AMP-acid ligase II
LKNILSTISEKVLKNPDKIAFAFMKEDSPGEGYDQITFKELDEKSSRAAILLSRQGFHEGVVTLVLVKPSIDFVILLYGMLKTGAVPLLLPSLNIRSRSGRRELRKILNRANPRGVIGTGVNIAINRLLSLSKKTDNVLRFAKLKKYYSNLDNPTSFDIASDLDWDESAAFVKYTTGTTGPSKGVIYTHGMLHSHLKVLESQGFTDRDVFYGRGGTLIVHPLIGMTSVVNMTSPKQTLGHNIVKTANQWNVTWTFLSPPSAINLAEYLVGQTNSPISQMIPSIRRLYVGGESVAAEVVEIIEPHLSEQRPSEGGFHLVYGATEGFPLCHASASTIIGTKHQTSSGMGVCVGREVGDVQLRILPFEEAGNTKDTTDMVSGTSTSQFSIGEISVNGPVVYSRLVGGDEEKFGGALSWAFDKNDGTYWHRTGDLGYRDREGRIWLVGRKSHRVELEGGLTLQTKQIEEFYNSLTGLRTALVRGLHGGKPVLLVEKHEGDWLKIVSIMTEHLARLSDLFGEDVNLQFIHYNGSFPVDKGHEAKIEREKLNSWAIEKLRHLE